MLARRGHLVTGLDSSAPLLADLGGSLRAEPPEVRDRVRLVRGDALRAAEVFEPEWFDAVLCHGVLMYRPDPGPLRVTQTRQEDIDNGESTEMGSKQTIRYGP